MRRFNGFARCTYYDGDATSIREALVLGVPVVASNTDFLPESVIKFMVGDVHELVGALKYARNHSNDIAKMHSG